MKAKVLVRRFRHCGYCGDDICIAGAATDGEPKPMPRFLKPAYVGGDSVTAHMIQFLSVFPFAIIGFVPSVLMLILLKNGTAIAASVFNGIGITALCLGGSVGIACLHRDKTFAAAPARA